MSIGEPLASSQLCRGDDRAVTTQLRERTLLLGQRTHFPPRPGTRRTLPLAQAQPRDFLRAEVESLPAENRLAATGELAVMWAEAARIPHLLREIGLRREETFRLAGEGTGRDLDLDRFDATYLHLFIWNQNCQELVGAYRMGRTDQLLAGGDLSDLYTSTLFRYRAELFCRLGPALELGRSFIRSEYQRSFSALLLLWRGIGEFVVRHPDYRFLLGPVSISADYQHLSRTVMADFLWRHMRHPSLAELVRPRRPFQSPLRHRHVARELGDLEEVSTLVAHLEPDHKGVPVLLRQYLKLGAHVLGLNTDPAFSNVLDALVLVDLTRTEPRVLRRYLGATGAESFLAYHAPHCGAPQALVG